MSTPSVNLMSSSLDVGSIVDNLIYVERAPIRRMESQITTLESKVTAFQSLNTKLSALSDALNAILYSGGDVPFVQPLAFSDRFSESLFSKCSIASSDEAKVSATATNPAATGSYSLTVNSLAQARTMASAGYADATSSPLGNGTITITTGSGDPVIVTVNSSNNTLNGLRDAINNAHAGVTATIINDGSTAPYRLMLTANDTGTANSFTVTDSLSGGQALTLAESRAATDAQFVINGISISKSSNTISDVISGITFNLKDVTTAPVTLTVQRDADSVVNALKEFVSAYNAVSSFINSQFSYDPTTQKSGVLSGDSALRNIQSMLQNPLIQSVRNQFTTFAVAGQIGLEFNRDGSLTLNESELRDAMGDDFTGVAALILGNGTAAGSATASDARVSYSGKTAATQAGTYPIQVNTLAQQASAIGNQIITSLANNETLTISCGTMTAIVYLAQNDSLSMVLSKINAAFAAQGMPVSVADDGTGRIKILTNNFGSSQTFTVVSDTPDGANTTGFGTIPVVATGVDIAGTIGGHAATGNGLTLIGAAGQPEEGLSINISQTTPGAYGSVTVASATEGVQGGGILTNLFGVLDGLTDPLSGPIFNATDGMKRNITSLNDQISAYEERLEVRRQILTAQFSRVDEALRYLSVTQSSLSSQLASLSK